MKVSVVGSSGLVGREFTRQFSNEHQLLPLTHNDLDITNEEAVRRVILDWQPALIVNCVVLGVDNCELDPSHAWAVNVSGAEHLARAAAEINADIVQISSNYVFDGQREKGTFYTAQDSPNPISVYGQTKLASERAVSAISHRCFIIRTSWVFGDGKINFFSSAHRSLRAGKKIHAITDVWANSTYVRDLVTRVAEILSGRHYSTYHVANSGLCSYYDFALQVARILHLSEAQVTQLIDPVELSEARLSGARPRYTPMRCTVSNQIGLAPLRDWREALAEYIRNDST